MHTSDVKPTNYMPTAEQDCVPIRNSMDPCQQGQAGTLCGRMDIAGNELRGNKVGRVFVFYQLKVLLWGGEGNNLAITESGVMYSSADTTPFDAMVGVVYIVNTSKRDSDWLGLA